MAGSNPEPAAPAEPAPSDDLDFGDAPADMGAEPSVDDKPFDDEPFDAGVEADEESDPKKFIEQLTGKLGQSLRKYNEEQGQPDFELEKFAINSLLSATHTSEMDAEDQKDIISKVKSAGQGDEDVAPESDEDMPTDELMDEPMDEPTDEEGLEEYRVFENMDNLFVNPKKNNMFQEGSNDILDEANPCWKGYKQVGMKEKNGKEVPNCVPVNEGEGLWANIHAKRERGETPAKPGQEDYPDKKQWDKLTKEDEEMGETNNYMFWQNLKNINDNAAEILGMDMSEIDALLSDGHSWAVEHVITSKDDVEEVYHFLEYNMESKPDMMSENAESSNYMFFASLKTILHASSEIMEMDENMIDSILSDGHGWAVDHIATAADDMEEVYHFLANTLNAYDGDTDAGYEDEYGNVEGVNINEAKYHGKTVKLGKPSSGDVKKFKVFVKNKKGKVVKVNFGDPNMEIKRDNPKRRKSFRARHKCAQAKDRTTPKYWSCRMWSKKPVSKIVENDSQEYSKKMLDMAHNAITRSKGKDYAPSVHELQTWIDNHKKSTNEGLQMLEKSSIFGKIKSKLRETFNQDDDMNQPFTEPAPVITPITKPSEKPIVQPSRKDKPFLPTPTTQPDPKALRK
jgi:hypothetical protein